MTGRWLPETTLRTDALGKLRFSGFLGDYELRSADASIPLSLSTPGTQEITLQLPTI